MSTVEFKDNWNHTSVDMTAYNINLYGVEPFGRDSMTTEEIVRSTFFHIDDEKGKQLLELLKERFED